MLVLIGAMAVIDRALAGSSFWARQGALLGANVLVAAGAVALLGRSLHPSPQGGRMKPEQERTP
jgi:hypothetical protein